MNQPATVTEMKPKSLTARFADKYGVDPEKLLPTLKQTAFRQQGNTAITNEQMMALLIVANEYGLNPFTKEIFAFPDKGGIVPVVSVDGWSRIINENPQMDGIEFEYSPETLTHAGKTCHEWIDCIIYRKDRSRPIRVREFFSEVSKNSGPWQSHPNRMHRHKAEIQCARIAFGFAGIYDLDEAERIMEASATTSPEIASYSDEQKKHFDYLIQSDDAVGMFLFIESIGHGLYTDLYHSFPKGEKGKYQQLVRRLQETGRSKLEDLRLAVSEAAEQGYDDQISELIGGLSDDALSWLEDNVQPAVSQAIQSVRVAA